MRMRRILAALGPAFFMPFPGLPIVNPFAAEQAHRYGGAITLGYQLTPHVTLGTSLSIHTERFESSCCAITGKIASRWMAPTASNKETIATA